MINDVARKSVHVDKVNPIPVCTIREYDDFILKLSLMKYNTPFDVAGQTVSLGVKAPSGLFEQTTDITINLNQIDIKLKKGIVSKAGTCSMELKLVDSTGSMTTASFFIVVYPRILSDGAVQASDEFDSLSKAVNEVEEDYKSLKRIIIDENQAADLQNQVNQTNAQLDNNTQQIQLLATKESITKLENEKANKDDVERQISSLASGSPRGTYTNLSALTVAFPSGNTNIYLTLDNMNWNYWNGSAWVSGGVYQSQTVKEKSVGDIELNVIYKIGKLISGGINFNFTTDILEITSGTIISDYTGFYSVANTENIMMSSDAYPKYVFFNIDTRLLHIEARWFKNNPRELLICCYYNKKVYFVGNNDLVKVNGENIALNFSSISGNRITDKTITKEKLWFSYSHGCVIQGGITLDLDSKKFTIASSTVVSDLTGFYNANNSGQEITFTNDLSTPVYLYFNTSTQLIHLENRWYSYDANELLLCTIYQREIHNSISKNFITLKNVNIEDVFSFKGKKFVSYGDSITQGNTWQNYLVNELGVSHTNLGLSSSCISSFDTWAVSMSDDSRINGIPEDTDIITIMGGTNDWVSRISIGSLDDVTRDTFIGGYKYLIEKVMDRIPNARIILMTPPFGYYNNGVGSGETNGVGKNLIEYINAVKSVAEYYKLPLINMYQDLGINKFNKDSFLVVEDVQVHPNGNGGKRIAGLVIGEMRRLN